MANLLYYICLTLLIIYIISPLDAHPLFLDDLIASGILFYLLYKNARQKRQRGYAYSQSHKEPESEPDTSFSLGDAYRLLDLNSDASWDEVKKAYKEKIAKSHPDKVTHLSKELQEKAKELTLKLNSALDIIKAYKKNR